MANRRMISKTISVSEKVAYLYQIAETGAQGFGEFSQLLYTWLLTHTDDWGRMSASGFHIKMTVMPSSLRSIEHFSLALKLMHNARLITVYGDNDNFLQVENFDEFQGGLIGKRTESKFPEIFQEFMEYEITSTNFEELPRISSLTKLNLTKPNLTKPKLKKIAPTPDNKDKKLFLDCVELTEEEHKKLIEKFGDRKANEMIENFNLALMSKKGFVEKYKSHYHTILNWERMNNGKQGGIFDKGRNGKTIPFTGAAGSDSKDYPVDCC